MNADLGIDTRPQPQEDAAVLLLWSGIKVLKIVAMRLLEKYDKSAHSHEKTITALKITINLVEELEKNQSGFSIQYFQTLTKYATVIELLLSAVISYYALRFFYNKLYDVKEIPPEVTNVKEQHRSIFQPKYDKFLMLYEEFQRIVTNQVRDGIPDYTETERQICSQRHANLTEEVEELQKCVKKIMEQIEMAKESVRPKFFSSRLDIFHLGLTTSFCSLFGFACARIENAEKDMVIVATCLGGIVPLLVYTTLRIKQRQIMEKEFAEILNLEETLLSNAQTLDKAKKWLEQHNIVMTPGT